MIIIPSKTVVMVSSNVTPDAMRDKMFDPYLNTQTQFATLIEVEIEFNNVDRVALFNLDAASVDFELTDNNTATVVQTKTIDLAISDGEYHQWIIEPLYIYSNATLKISLHNSGGIAACGKCGIGLSTDVGVTLYDHEIGFVDYSIKATDEFGQTYLNPGAWAKLPDIKTRIPFGIIDAVFEDLRELRGTFVFFDGNQGEDDLESLRIYGFLEDWRIKIKNKLKAEVTFSIQGAI